MPSRAPVWTWPKGRSSVSSEHPAGEEPPAEGSAPPPRSAGPSPGADLARGALASARAAAKARGVVPRPKGSRRGGDRLRRGGYSGPGPDARDPQPLGSAVRGLLRDRGWEQTSQASSVLADWERVVGADIAAHCRPASLTDGVLTIEAESTAWATQLRLLSPRIHAAIVERVGSGVVSTLRVHGPTSPSWSKGSRRVVGRGPRDTYG